MRLQENSAASPNKKVRRFSFRTKDQQRPRVRDKAPKKSKIEVKSKLTERAVAVSPYGRVYMCKPTMRMDFVTFVMHLLTAIASASVLWVS